MEGVELEQHYRETLPSALGEQGGMLGLIFEQGAEQDPGPGQAAPARRRADRQGELVGDVADVKGDAYEGLLERNAQDVKGGAGQYFTPRAAHRRDRGLRAAPARRDRRRPRLRHRRLPARRARVRRATSSSTATRSAPALRGAARHELVPNVARLCAMNLYLHGIGPDGVDDREPPIRTDDALRDEPGEPRRRGRHQPALRQEVVDHVVNEEGETDRETLTYNRPDFWTTTSNKQLNFVQHVKSLLKIHGRAAVVVPDNVLFEGGAGETVRRKLLKECESTRCCACRPASSTPRA
jgi:type I restriction enzyme M protein